MRYMYFVSGLFGILLLVNIMACGSGPSPQTAMDEHGVPVWFTNPPQDPDHMYSANTQVSTDLQVAVDKATQNARAEIATQIEAHITRMFRNFTDEIGASDRGVLRQLWNDTMEGIVDQTISGSRAAQTHYVKEGQGYRAFVLVEMSLDFANDHLMNRISRQEELYTEFKASKSFEEMERRVEEYRKFKQERGGY